MKIIPQAKSIELRDGCFKMDLQTAFAMKDSEPVNRMVNELKGFISKELGLELGTSLRADKTIVFDHTDTNYDYELEINAKSINIQAKNDEGLFHGMQTLKQLILLYKRCIPNGTIKDSPEFGNRGFYHDVTRGKVPKLETLKKLVDKMAFFKLNQLQLYVEHTFLFSGQSEVWSVTDPLTAEEILELDRYCNDRFIELVPSLTTFGHLYEALQSLSFQHLSEYEAKESFSFIDRMRHHTLNTTLEESISFVKRMMDDFVPLFRSNKLNICADETFDLGEGKSKEIALKVGKSRMYVDFLNQIISHARTFNKEIMFWGDMILEHPEYVIELPKDLICLNWWYEREYPEEKVRFFAEKGLKQYLCPGVSGWNRLMNNHLKAYDNIKMMTGYGKKYQALGVLNTDWGDFGHWNFLGNSLPGLIYGAAFSWGDERSFEQMNEDINEIYYETNTDMMGILTRLSNCHIMDLNAFVRWFEKRDDYFLEQINVKEDEVMKLQHEIDKIIDEFLDALPNLSFEKRKEVYGFIISAQGIQWMNMLYLVLAERNQKIKLKKAVDSWKLAENIEHWLFDFKKQWHEDNKASELYRVALFLREVCIWLRKGSPKEFQKEAAAPIVF